jgi:hypothetical protein
VEVLGCSLLLMKAAARSAGLLAVVEPCCWVLPGEGAAAVAAGSGLGLLLAAPELLLPPAPLAAVPYLASSMPWQQGGAACGSLL